MASKNITVTELDFDAIKSNLKNYLKSQSTFQDYDFDGSSLSVLLDVLAYNTHYNALYNNLSINEMFLDSARKRNSVVSIAKGLGYTPSSATCATAIVNITVNVPSGGPSTITLPAYTPFNTIVNGTSYTFYNRSAVTASGTTTYQFTNVVLYSGTPLSNQFIVDTGSKFIIPNNNVDTSTITVRVYENSISSTFVTYNFSDTLLDITSTSTAYWIKEIDNGLYELVFGDGIIGKALVNGNKVVIDYMVSDLDTTNGARVFNYSGSPLVSNSTLSVSTVTPAYNGQYPEDIERIRNIAPKAFAAQNRAVSIDDYKALIYDKVSSAKSVTVWGGEDNNPPVYGKVYICIEPATADAYTDTQKTDILKNVLANRKAMTVSPIIVDPEYLDVILNISVYYNQNLTTRSASDLSTIVTDSIVNFNNQELRKFDCILRHSKLTRLIDECEQSISNSNLTLSLRKKIIPKFNTNASYKINIINPIYYSGVPEDMVLSSGFYIQGSSELHYIVDDGAGNLNLFYYVGNVRTLVKSVGTVDYGKGLINISGINIQAISGDSLYLYIKTQSMDVVSAYNQIVRISESDLIVNIIADKTATGDYGAGKNYIFTSSRD